MAGKITMDKQQERRVTAADGSTLIINSFSAEDATETMYELLQRAILNNAEAEFKKKRGLTAQNSASILPKD